MYYNFTGELVKIEEIKNGLDKNGEKWFSQQIILKNDKGFFIAFTIFGMDKIEQFNFKTGDKLTVLFVVNSYKINDLWITYARIVNWSKILSPKEEQGKVIKTKKYNNLPL